MLLVRIVALLLLTCFGVAHGFVLRMAEGFSDGAMSRREAVSAIASSAALAGVLVAQPSTASAVVKTNRLLGQESFRKIRDVRQSMDDVDVFLRARKFSEAHETLETGPAKELAKSLTDLVQSNSLPTEDKVAVGTIRRYGLAADALIAMGGLNAATGESDSGEARRMLKLAKEALNDILTIGVNNDLNK